MRIMIVDDEKPVHDALHILLDQEQFGIKEVIDAYDAAEAITLFEEKNPELILLDMKMPEIDGVKLMNLLEEKKKDTMFIIISGYDYYEYTRSAIRSNTVDYLLKPINRDELNDALGKAISIHRTRENERKQKRYYEKVLRPLEREQYLREYLRSGVKDQGFAQSLLPEVFESDNYITDLGVGIAVNGGSVCARLFECDSKMFIMALSNILSELIGKWGYCYVFCVDRVALEFVVFIALKKEENKDINQYVLRHLQKNLEEIYRLLQLKMIFVMSDFCEKKDYSSLYHKVNNALSETNLLVEKPLAVSVDTTNSLVEDFGIHDKRVILEHCFRQKDNQAVTDIVDTYFSGIMRFCVFTKKMAEWIWMEWLSELKYLQKKCDFVFPIAEKTILERELRRNDYSLDWVWKTIRGIVQEALAAYTHYGEEKQNYASLIRNYIDEYYYTEINIQTFSEQFYMSRNYLSKLFRTEYEIGIYEYLLQVRMKHAALMLEDPNIKIRYISERLCFKDNNYFSKAFRNYYGITPTEYRKKHMENV